MIHLVFDGAPGWPRRSSSEAPLLCFELRGIESGIDGSLSHGGLKGVRSLYNFANMPSSIQPLSALDPDLLVEYLGREGHSAEEVRWKYFDSRFNRGRERGYAWVKDGKMGGFLGLVPFQVVARDRVIEAAWTCDWSVQDPTARGIGILLMRQAQEKYEFLTQLGGNEATQRIISRLSNDGKRSGNGVPSSAARGSDAARGPAQSAQTSQSMQ